MICHARSGEPVDNSCFEHCDRPPGELDAHRVRNIARIPVGAAHPMSRSTPGKRKKEPRSVQTGRKPRIAKSSRQVPGAMASPVDTAEVHERIWSAIMDHSLPPETRLVEGDLCEIFGLGRTRLRQVLQRLAHERVVTLMHNRGAMVSKPSVREAREVFAARRVIEANIVETFIETATRKDVKRLQEHLAREQDAWRSNNRRAMLKLSGEFH